MTKQFLYFAFLFVAVTFFACQQKQGVKGDVLPKIDTNDASATYLKVKDASAEVIDTTYNNLLIWIEYINKYELLDQHLNYYEKLAGERPFAIGTIQEFKGLIDEAYSKYDAAQLRFDTALGIFQKIHDIKKVGECFYCKSLTYLAQENYPLAVDYNLSAQHISEQLKDTDQIFRLKVDQGIYFDRLNDFQKSADTLRSCLAYYRRRPDSFMIDYCLSTLSSVYGDMKKFGPALDYAKQAYDLAGQADSTPINGENLNNMAMAYQGLHDYTKAIFYLEKSLQIAINTHDPKHISTIKQNLAYCYKEVGNYAKAEQLLNDLIPEVEKLRQWHLLSYIYKNLSDVYKGEKKYEQALSFYAKHKAYNDIVFSQEKAKIVNELNIKYETEKNQVVIAQLTANRKLDEVKKITYLITLVFTIVVAILTILFLRNRNKKNKLLMEKVQTDLENKNRELQHFTENIINKNKLIEVLETKLQSNDIRVADEENSDQLSALYQLKILTEDNWHQFKILFDKVYPGYINRLRKQYPELTPAEERQSLLTKLKIDTKECANMLGISTQSVKKNRYRLKKRFNLTEQEDLDDFVLQF